MNYSEKEDLLSISLSVKMAQHGVTSSPLKTTTGDVIKYTVEHYRKDGVSAEALMDWFNNVVVPKAVPVLQKHNIVKFAVVSCKITILTGELTDTVWLLAQDRSPSQRSLSGRGGSGAAWLEGERLRDRVGVLGL